MIQIIPYLQANWKEFRIKSFFKKYLKVQHFLVPGLFRREMLALMLKYKKVFTTWRKRAPI